MLTRGVIAFWFIFLISNSHFAIATVKETKRKAYAKVSGGFVFFKKFKAKNEDDVYEGAPKNSFSTSVALGYDFHKNISMEILGRFSPLRWKHIHENTSTRQQKTKIYSLFTNIYFKCFIGKRIIPYLVLGPGYTLNESRKLQFESTFPPSGSISGRNIHSFVWNVGLGFMLKLSRKLAVDINYRYMDLGKIGFKADNYGSTSETKKVKANDISIGLIYKF